MVLYIHLTTSEAVKKDVAELAESLDTANHSLSQVMPADISIH